MDRDIKLYHYTASPYARKIVWYLALRGLQYSEVKQPVIMPRPDLQAIGVNYRRIPVMAIGKDVYCDTRIILRKLEQLFPEGAIGATSPDGLAVQKLFEVWHVEGPLFFRGVNSMPSRNFSAPEFQKDREQMTGRPWNRDAMDKQRPESLAYLQSVFKIYENLLSDGREWIISTHKPSLADIEAVFVLHWLYTSKALSEDLFPRSSYSKTFAWIERFDAAIKSAKNQSPKPISLEGSKAAEQILAASYAENESGISSQEPQQLSVGDRVELYPTDSGFNNKDHGKLSSLTDDEIVIQLENGVRIHTPRAGFRVGRAGSKL